MKKIARGQYVMPENSIAIVVDGILTIRESRAQKVREGHRCRECKHFQKGLYMAKYTFESTICILRPKTYKKGQDREYFYHVAPADIACEKFEPLKF